MLLAAALAARGAGCSEREVKMSNLYYTVDNFGNFYRIGSPEAVFCYLIVGREKAMLIDTGYAFGDLRGAVRSITEKPLYIVNTHGHLDHACGNAQFDEPVYIHENDISLCLEHTGKAMRSESADRAAHSVNYQTHEVYNALPADFDRETYISRGAGKLEAVEDGHVFDLGGATLETVFTPGHTKGGISLWYREKNIAFVGDATGFFVWLFAPETTDRETYIGGLNRLIALDAESYWGGHNDKPMTKADLQLYVRAAKEADFAKGQKFESFLNGAEEVRVCALDGKTIDNMFEPGFAALVITKDK